MPRISAWLAALTAAAAMIVATASGGRTTPKVPRIAYVYRYEFGPSAPIVDG